ncbi:hypothetical protein GGI04_003487 [Coemansia thaxteri]|nr:hypothetical protein GGI04_003487 [Coemansia thaxteri]KAJ2470038.1 hypothetical protein GGI02_003198 [Coemansia sp. RSA 2322]
MVKKGSSKRGGDDKVRAGKIEKKRQPTTNANAQAIASEIDDIFAAKKQVAPAAAAAEPLEDAVAVVAKASATSGVTVVDATAAASSVQQQKMVKPKNDDFADSRGKSSKYTEDGLRVYYMDDLRIGEGEGDTPECPFDCNCCF